VESQWKPCLKVPADKDAPRPERKHGVKSLNPTFGQNNKPRAERKHSEAGAQTMATWEEKPSGKITYMALNNRKTTDEVDITKTMGSKKRITTMFEARNGLKMASLGDKNYKSPEYQAGFFREGGLVPGST